MLRMLEEEVKLAMTLDKQVFGIVLYLQNVCTFA